VKPFQGQAAGSDRCRTWLSATADCIRAINLRREGAIRPASGHLEYERGTRAARGGGDCPTAARRYSSRPVERPFSNAWGIRGSCGWDVPVERRRRDAEAVRDLRHADVGRSVPYRVIYGVIVTFMVNGW
jgi:hypothetical protein